MITEIKMKEHKKYWGDGICTYPKCKCPFDAPADHNWCAKGWRKKNSRADKINGIAHLAWNNPIGKNENNN